MDINKINEDLIYNYHKTIPINEMAILTGGIEVHNDDDNSIYNEELKFAHFHYKGIHFRFSNKCPKNATQIRKMIAFKREQNDIDDYELTQLVKILNSKPQRKGVSAKNIYDWTMSTWVGLNGRDIDYID